MATALQVESIWNGLTDNSGQPLAAGRVYTYAAGTSNPVSLYTASDKTSSATNPLILDGNGKAQVWADGRYKFVVKTSADVTLYTLDNLLYGFDDTTVLLGGISTGSANAQTVSVPATVESYANGQRITFIAGFTNTGATTLKFNSLSAISIVKGPTPSSLQAGDLIAGQLYSCTYYGGSFRLENVPTPADVQRSRAQLISSVAGTNVITGTVAPALVGYETGSVFRFKAANTTGAGAVTLNIDSLGAKTIQYNNAALAGGEIGQNIWHEVVYDGTQFQLLNPINVSAPLWGGTSGGSANAQTITAAPAIAAYAAGQKFSFIAGYTNTSTATLNVNGLGTKNIYYAQTKAALKGNEIIAGSVYSVVYDGTQFLLLNTLATGTFTNDAVANNKINLFKSRGTTAGTHTIVQNGDQLGGVWFWGANGSDYDPAAAILATSDGTPGASGDMPGALRFYTTPDGSATLTEKMIIRNDGKIGIGASVPSEKLTIASAAGASAGVSCFGNGNSSSGEFFVSQSGTSEAYVWQRANAKMIFGSNNVERMQIASSGEIGMNAAAAASCTLFIKSPGATGSFWATRMENSSNTGLFSVDGAGNIYTGGAGLSPYNNTTGIAANVYVASNGILQRSTSSARYKTDIQPYTRGLNDILGLAPKFYKGKNDGDKQFAGLIAEDVHDLGLTEFVVYNDQDQPDALSYGNMVALTFKAIQELNAKVEALEARVAALEA